MVGDQTVVICSWTMKPDVLSRNRFDAVLFDLDGVLTATAKIHAACWKRMFDEYLRMRDRKSGAPLHPFEIETDYKEYIDGKLRYDGVRDFLKSRAIELPEGNPDDPPTVETVCGLGNRKNDMINDVLESEGVEPYQGSVALVAQLRRQGMKTAVVSSSHNCLAVLQAAKMADLFDARVDGDVAERLHLRGKPAPDTFLAAATQLGVSRATRRRRRGRYCRRPGGSGRPIWAGHWSGSKRKRSRTEGQRGRRGGYRSERAGSRCMTSEGQPTNSFLGGFLSHDPSRTV